MKKVCYDCIHHILSEDGECLECKWGYFQDESITLVCSAVNGHGCRGWGNVCSHYTVKRCPDHKQGPYDIWDNMPCSERSPNGFKCNNINSEYFGGRCIEESKSG